MSAVRFRIRSASVRTGDAGPADCRSLILRSRPGFRPSVRLLAGHRPGRLDDRDGGVRVARADADVLARWPGTASAGPGRTVIRVDPPPPPPPGPSHSPSPPPGLGQSVISSVFARWGVQKPN